MIRNLKGLLVALALSPSAAGALLVHDPACKQRTEDPYDPALRFDKGSFKGRCADATSVRPLILKSSEGDALTIANFYHADRFWLARIPKHAVAQVLFHIVPFPSGFKGILAAHTQLRFLFKPGSKIALTSQETGDRATAEVDDVLISTTIVAPPGVAYSAAKSFGGSYGIATRAMSSLARAKEEILHDKSTVRQFVLRLSDEEKERLLVLALVQADAVGYRQTYQLLDNNCATVVFDNLDRVHPPPPDVPPMRGHLWLAHDEFIKPSLKALTARKLIDAESEIAPMNDEVSCDETAQRCVRK